MSLFKKTSKPEDSKPEDSKAQQQKVVLDVEELKKVTGGGLRDVVVTPTEEITEDTKTKA